MLVSAQESRTDLKTVCAFTRVATSHVGPMFDDVIWRKQTSSLVYRAPDMSSVPKSGIKF